MKIRFTIFSLLLCTLVFAQRFHSDSLLLKKATNHPMQYYLSLPVGWNKNNHYPVVVIIESANKEYRENALRFVRARKSLPFILLAPFNVNNSRSGRRDSTVFPYSNKDWDFIEKTGDCQFNLDGILQAVDDVEKAYGGERNFFITGFEAGAHTVWQFTFQRPERLKAAAPVAGNFNQNSCMESEFSYSKNSARINLPVNGFASTRDTLFGPASTLYNQWKKAKAAALAHGFQNIHETVVPNKTHEPLPAEVLQWFHEIEQKQGK